MASSVVTRSPEVKISRTGREACCLTEAFHRSDSGTKNVISNVSNAGAAPTSMTQRQEPRVMLKKMPMSAMSA